MEKVVDSNYLQSDELLDYLARSPKNLAVLTDYAAMEAYKGDTLKSIYPSMEILGKFPRQVIILKDTQTVCGLTQSLKGVSASSLSALAAIPPVMELNKEDRRFIEGRNATDGLSEATNLASMDWSDFEHLVRELFEKEFATRGGEVKITQASADGGVDAVAFDPDPITGGKIVIQAKRYTRTVGVSAVRDLFGTVQHEGASRGILITTADYGPDAYQFASGKPVTLFTGANLLHLLEKHGYKAKIDLREARKELNLRDHG